MLFSRCDADKLERKLNSNNRDFSLITFDLSLFLWEICVKSYSNNAPPSQISEGKYFLSV